MHVYYTSVLFFLFHIAVGLMDKKHFNVAACGGGVDFNNFMECYVVNL